MSRKLLGCALAVCFLLQPTWGVAEEVRSDESVKEVTDVPYYDGKDAHERKHKLDLYIPKDKKDCPVLFFVHGGAWRKGDKAQLGIYRGLGRSFAKKGILTVVPNYRLSPLVKHPGHIEDVARAFVWTYKNIAKYGGRPDRLFLSGHSAGGHLTALLATDSSYLKKYELTTKIIRGVAPISGVFIIPDRLLPQVFTNDRAVRKQASPITHVRAGLPPFRIFYADHDFPYCGKPEAEQFAKALRDKGTDVKTTELKNSNHIFILGSASVAGQTVFDSILSFIESAK